MHPRYVSTSFVSFPFSLSSFSSERTIQGYIESRRTRAAPTHTHTRYRFTLGDPCETNAHKAEGRRRRGYIRDVSRRYCRCKLLCLACLLDGEHQLQLDSNACKEIHVVSTTTTNNNDNDDDDNLIKFQTIRIRRFKRKKKKNYTETIPIPAMAPRGNGFIPAVLMGFRVIPIHNTRQSIREHYLRA